ncbi:hypothetical protein MPPM_3654 [Methylorubrum populi]|uniref:Uncharacterized protein n=2 Tax=Methylobacteriaceae TaxID=119045 RepID=A0A160PG75_9HYPH|nr:hypothetical protein MPPM_3654 [Methylorubrum populi]
MSHAIEWQRFVHHNDVTVTLMPRPALPGRAHAGLPTRLVLSALAGLLSLLVVIGLPADGAALGGVPQARAEATFEQRPDTDPLASVRVGRVMLDLDEVASHGRVSAILPGPDGADGAALPRPASDRNPDAAERGPFERPPRT